MEKEASERIQSYEDDRVFIQWREALRHYDETGAPAHLFVYNDEAQWDACLELLRCREVESYQIVEFSYDNHAGYYSRRHGYVWEFEGAQPVNEVIQSIADVDAQLLTFPNDFKIVLKVLRDTETAVEFIYESNTTPVVCERCRVSTDPLIVEDLELNPEFSCRHADDELSISMSANVTRRT